MAWLLIIGAIVIIFMVASASRKAKQRAAVRGFREHFPHIARLRLVAACPDLDGLLDETSLRLLFDWMLLELHRRTGTSDFGELMRWEIENPGQGERMVFEVIEKAIDRLPPSVLAVIDGCEGRLTAAVILDQSLSEAGSRISAALEHKYV